MSKKYTLLTFKGICMNFLLELKIFILSHPVTSKQPHKIVQIHMVHPVFGTLSLNDISQAFIYLLSLPNFMDFHVFHGYPHILRFYIYFHETY